MAHVLLIDDDPLVRQTLRGMLEELGHSVVEADEGRSAMSLLKGNPVDVVITDILMPHSDGIEVIMEIRKSRKGVRVIAVSGGGGTLGATDILTMARKLGAHQVLQKPIQRDQLMLAIESTAYRTLVM